MKNSSWMMLICCLGPLLLLVLAPALGLDKQNLSWIVFPAMLLVCFMMMGKGGGCCGGHHEKESDKKDNKTENKNQKCH